MACASRATRISRSICWRRQASRWFRARCSGRRTIFACPPQRTSACCELPAIASKRRWVGSVTAAAGEAADRSRIATMKPKFYVGTIGMSVWFTEDLGETWSRPNSEYGLNNESRVWALASHPDHPGHVLAGTDRGLHRWDEREKRWQHLPSPMDGMPIWSLQHAPHDAELIVAGVSPGALYRSRDGARSWERLSLRIPETCMFNLTSRVTQIVFDPIDRDTIWASVEIDAIHRSVDGGETWTRLSNGLTTDDVHGIEVVREGDRRVVLAAVNRGVHRSEDDGESFERVALPSPWQYTRAVVAKASQRRDAVRHQRRRPSGLMGAALPQHRSRTELARAHAAGRAQQHAMDDLGASLRSRARLRVFQPRPDLPQHGRRRDLAEAETRAGRDSLRRLATGRLVRLRSRKPPPAKRDSCNLRGSLSTSTRRDPWAARRHRPDARRNPAE